MRKLLYSLLVVFSLFVFKGCDVINGVPDKDLIDKIDNKIEWQNAAKLEVTVDFPDDWGRSTHKGFNRVGDVRKGFPFNVEFFPEDDYAITEWRVYRTEDLKQVPRWKENPGNYLYGIEPITDAVFPEVDPYGNGDEAYPITLNVEEPVTLVPFCNEQPRITRIGWDTDLQSRSRNATIRVQFAGSIKNYTFGENNVRITGGADTVNHDSVFRVKGTGTGDTENVEYYYEVPSFENRWLTILPRGSSPPPADTHITFRLGSGIQTPGGKGLPADKIDSLYTFTWTTFKDVIALLAWEAEYDKNNNLIIVKVTYRGDRGSFPHAALYYNSSRVDPPHPEFKTSNHYDETEFVRGEKIDEGFDDILGNYDIYEAVLAFTPDAAFNGSHGSGRGYNIQIALKADEEVIDTVDHLGIISAFQMFNVPGLKANNEKPIIRITEISELTALSTAETTGNTYVFDNSSEIHGTGASWTPLGTAGSSFKGSFYGMGTNFTVTSLASSENMGFFGYTEGALIQDINVSYNNALNITSTNFGGAVGYANNTTLNNVKVSYNADISFSGSTAKSWGGAAGVVTSSSTVMNSSVSGMGSLIASGSGASLGGIAGSLQGTIDGCFVTTNIDAASAGSFDIGGIAGRVTGTITRSWTSGTVKATGTGSINAGGLAGILNSAGAVISNSYSVGNVEITSSSGDLMAGGLAGLTENGNITKSFTKNNVTIISPANTGKSYAGGITGLITQGKVSNCVTVGGIINVNAPGADNAYFRIGKETSNNLENNYARANILVLGAYSPNDAHRKTTGSNGENILTSRLKFAHHNFWNGTVGFASPWVFDNLTGGHPLLGLNDPAPIDIQVDMRPISQSITIENNSLINRGTIVFENGITTEAEIGETVVFNILPNSGYSVVSVSGPAAGDHAGPYTFDMPETPVTIALKLKANTYELSTLLTGHNAGAGSTYKITVTTAGTSTLIYDDELYGSTPLNVKTEDVVSIQPTYGTGDSLINTNGITLNNSITGISPAPDPLHTGAYTFEMPPNDSIIQVTMQARVYELGRDGTLEEGIVQGGTFILSSYTGNYNNQTITITATPTPGWHVTGMSLYSDADPLNQTPLTELGGVTWNGTSLDQLAVGRNTGTFKIPHVPIGERVMAKVVFSKVTYTTSCALNSEQTTKIGTSPNEITTGRWTLSSSTGVIQLGETLTVTISQLHAVNNPTWGWEFDSITLNGNKLAASALTSSGNTHTFAITVPSSGTVVTVSVDFKKKTYSTSPSLNTNQQVNPGGYWYLSLAPDSAAVQIGEKLRINFSNVAGTSNFTAGYEVDRVTINNTNTALTAAGSTNGTIKNKDTTNNWYEFEITSAMAELLDTTLSGVITVSAPRYSKRSYTVTGGTPTDGSITSIESNNVLGTAVYQVDNTVTVTVEPDPGYRLTGLTITREDTSAAVTSAAINGNTATFTMTSSNLTVTPTFALKNYTITPLYGGTNGTFELVTGETSDTRITSNAFTYNSTAYLRVEPEEGYEINTISITYGGDVAYRNIATGTRFGLPVISGTEKEGITRYRFQLKDLPHNADVTLSVTFKLVDYKISLCSPTGAPSYYITVKNPGGGIASGPTQITYANYDTTTILANVQQTIEITAPIGYSINRVIEIIFDGITSLNNYLTWQFMLNDSESFKVYQQVNLVTVELVGVAYTLTRPASMSFGSITFDNNSNTSIQKLINETTNIYANPNAGYRLGSITINGNGRGVTYSTVTSTYPFTLTAEDIPTAYHNTSGTIIITPSFVRKKVNVKEGTNLTLSTTTPEDEYDTNTLISFTAAQVPNHSREVERNITYTSNGITATKSFTEMGWNETATSFNIPNDADHNSELTVNIVHARKTVTIAYPSSMPSGGAFEIRSTSIGAGKATGQTIYVDNVTATSGYRVVEGTYNGAGVSGTFTITGGTGNFEIPDGVSNNGTITVSVTFALKTVNVFAVSPSLPGGSFTFSPIGGNPIAVGGTVEVNNINAEEGYYINGNGTYTGAGITDGTFTISGTSGAFTIPPEVTHGETIYISVPFTAKSYTVSPTQLSRIVYFVSGDSATNVGSFSVNVGGNTVGTTISGANVGATVTVASNITTAGYTFDSMTVTTNDSSYATITPTENTFVLPDLAHNATITIAVTAKKIQQTISTSVTPVQNPELAKINVTSTQSGVGDTVTYTVNKEASAQYYRLVSTSVTATSGGNGADVSGPVSGVYSFTMPANAVTINANYTNEYDIIWDITGGSFTSPAAPLPAKGTYNTTVNFAIAPTTQGHVPTVAITASNGGSLFSGAYSFNVTNIAITSVTIKVTYAPTGALLRTPTTERFTNRNQGSGFRVQGVDNNEQGTVSSARPDELLAQKLLQNGPQITQINTDNPQITQISADYGMPANILILPYTINNPVNNEVEDVRELRELTRIKEDRSIELRELTRIEEESVHELHELARIRNIIILALYLCLANAMTIFGIRRRK